MVTGCDSPQASRPVTPPTPPSAEETLKRIVDALKERVEDQSLTSTADALDAYNAPPGTPITDSTVRVTHELAPADPDGGPRRGSICFTSTSRVTIVLPPPDVEEDEADSSRRDREISQLESELEGVADLDSLRVPSRQSAATRLGNSPVHEIEPETSSTCYEIEFRENRWVLLTEPDHVNQPFYALAIEYAMGRQ